MFHLTRLLKSNKTWRGKNAFRACVISLSLAFALALYFVSPFNSRPVVSAIRDCYSKRF